jgi:hypothetical protein
MFRKGKFVAFTGSAGSKASSKNRDKPKDFSLPIVKSVKVGRVSEFRMGIEERAESFPPKECKSIFRGTLHVIGRGTTHNVYHTGEYNLQQLPQDFNPCTSTRPEIFSVVI